MRLFKSTSPQAAKHLRAGDSSPAGAQWVLDAHAVYRGGHPALPGRDRDNQWLKCRIRIDAEQLVYTNASADRSLSIPRSVVAAVHLLDGAAQPFSASRKPAKGLCACLQLRLEGGTTDVTFAFFGVRAGPYRHAAATFLRLFRPLSEPRVALPRGSTLTLETATEVAAVLSNEFIKTKFTGFEALSLRSALVVGGQYQVLGRAYPLVEAKIGEVRVGKVKAGRRCLGTMTMGGTRPLVMSLSEKFLDEDKEVTTEDTLTLGAELCFHPPGCDTYASVVSHEFGHAVNDYLTKLSGNKLVPLELEKMLAPKLCPDISKYATANRNEAFAEAFAMIRHSPRQAWPRPAVLLEQLLDREIGKAGAFTPYGAIR